MELGTIMSILCQIFVFFLLVLHALVLLLKVDVETDSHIVVFVQEVSEICCLNMDTFIWLVDNIQVMVIVWRLRGNIIRTALCWIV